MASDHLNLPHPVPDVESDLAALIVRFAFRRDVTVLPALLDCLRDGGRAEDLSALEKIVGAYLAGHCLRPTAPYWTPPWDAAVVKPVLALFWFDLYSHKLTADALAASFMPSKAVARPAPQPMAPDPVILRTLEQQRAMVEAASAKYTAAQMREATGLTEPTDPEQ